MKLKEILDLRLIRNNVIIYEFIPTAEGLGSLEILCEVVRSFGIVEVNTLLSKGLNVKHLNYDIIEMFGSHNAHKLGIVIKKPKQ